MVHILKYIADVSFFLSFANLFSLHIAVLVTPIVIYAVYYLIKLRRTDGYFEYNHIFRLFLMLYLPFYIFASFFGRQEVETRSLPFALIFLLSSVALMRTSRIQASGQFGLKLINLLPILIIPTLGFVVINAVLLIPFLYFNIVVPVLLVLIVVLEFILTTLFSGMANRIEPIQLPGTAPVADTSPFLPNYGYTGLPAWASFFAIGLMILALVLVSPMLIRLFRQIFGARWVDLKNEGKVSQEYLSLVKTTKGQKRGSLKHVRKYYRKFLLLCWRNGIPNECYMTSADYERLAGKKFELADEAAKLREMYVPVRYGNRELKREDGLLAKDLYNRMKKRI